MIPRSLPAGGIALALALTGCGSWGRVGSQPTTEPGETLTQILDLSSVYKRLGRLTGAGAVPFVADVAFFGGHGDSAVAAIAVSIESRHLAFQREGDAFLARYRVTLSAEPESGGASITLAREQSVRVGTFAETQRNDESVLFQDGLTLSPGRWKVSVELRDQTTGRAGKGDAAYTVPPFGPGSLSAPTLAYQSRPRSSRSAPVAVILNPRGTLAYGGDSAMAYVEAYGLTGPRAVPISLSDARDSVVLRDTLRFSGGQEVESQVLRFAPDSAPLGELRVDVVSGSDTLRSMALVSFSQNWVVTNFDDMLSLLRYFPPSPALDSLRQARPEERGSRWKSFWRESDPNSATPANEALDGYFLRVAAANQRFRGEGVQGWRTDRGEVLIRLGEPDEIFDASPQSEGRLIRWGYTQYQLALYFVDETGFGRFRLTPASRSDLERIVARISRQTT